MQLGAWRSAVSSRSGVRGRALTAHRFSTIFGTQDGLSLHYNIANCELSWSRWGQDHRASPLRMPRDA